MDSKEIRENSIDYARSLGIKIPEAVLPLQENELEVRNVREIFSRLLTLHALAAISYGLDVKQAEKWLVQENLFSNLSTSENEFIHNKKGDPELYKNQIEAMWALAWILGLVEENNYAKSCDDKFVLLLPNLKVLESSNRLAEKMKIRDKEEILESHDIAYCLHWAIIESKLNKPNLPKIIDENIVTQRRKTLEWVLGKENWEDINLDT